MDSDPSAQDLQCQVLQSTLDEISTRQEDSADCCVICLEAVSEVCEALPCHHHNFDYLCLLSWLEQTPKCPLCKATVAQVRHALDGPVAKVYQVPQPAPSSSKQDSRQYTSSGQYHNRTFQRPRRDRPHDATRNERISHAVTQRRDVYRYNRYSKHVGSNRVSQYRELTPALFCADEELVSRARMWIRRELQVFSFLNIDDAAAITTRSDDTNTRGVQVRRRVNNAEFLLEYIIAVLKSVDIMGSGGQAENMLAEFLGRDDTRLFLHELRAWLRSPYTKLEDWDRAVQYDESETARSSRPEIEWDTTTETVPGENIRQDTHFRDRHIMKGDFYRPRHGRIERQRPSPRYVPYGRRSKSSGREGTTNDRNSDH
ncbi:hypothetical protein B0J13DRAFT_110492 [Dactylonectria estremocensis]|uniref:RING-type E3 ubiquitin transferase n=1 Tax=Dactylonectria estremocensis TaxID=1079267 RepID=A0A9P9JHY9_9HYPO|nr:hypothetical protein B0J13DRAFT_110492 [Dactylonectria estremocensis]